MLLRNTRDRVPIVSIDYFNFAIRRFFIAIKRFFISMAESVLYNFYRKS